MKFGEWWQKEGAFLFSDFIALRADPSSIARKVWDAAQESCQPKTMAQILKAVEDVEVKKSEAAS